MRPLSGRIVPRGRRSKLRQVSAWRSQTFAPLGVEHAPAGAFAPPNRVELPGLPALGQQAHTAGGDDVHFRARAFAFDPHVGDDRGDRDILVPQQRAREHALGVVLAEGADPRVLDAAVRASSDGIALPVLIGDRAAIKAGLRDRGANAGRFRLEDPSTSPLRARASSAAVFSGGPADSVSPGQCRSASAAITGAMRWQVSISRAEKARPDEASRPRHRFSDTPRRGQAMNVTSSTSVVCW